jgi:hypothetical protein
LKSHRSLLQPLGFLPTLLVGCALACGDLIEGALLPLHRWMASFLDPRISGSLNLFGNSTSR